MLGFFFACRVYLVHEDNFIAFIKVFFIFLANLYLSYFFINVHLCIFFSSYSKNMILQIGHLSQFLEIYSSLAEQSTLKKIVLFHLKKCCTYLLKNEAIII